MADMVNIMSISKDYSLTVIEDATEALGTYYIDGEYKGRFAGTIGDVGIYSFNGNKIITTGGGGMIVSNSNEILNHAKHLTTQAKTDEVYYTHDEIGYNYRMTNLQAALGLAQLEQLETFIEVKKANYMGYKEAFKNESKLSLISFRSDIRPNYWFYSLYISSDCKTSRNELIEFLQNNKIQTRPIWDLIHEQLPYSGSLSYDIKTALMYLAHIVNLPCSTNLLEKDVQYVASKIIEGTI